MQITLWEHCAAAAFSLNAFWGLLVTPVGHAVSPDVCPPSPVLVLSPTWEHKWQAAFKQAMLHLWNLSSRWFLMSCYCLISWGVAWLEPCTLSLICSCFQLWDKRGSWRGAAGELTQVLGVIGDEQLLLGCSEVRSWVSGAEQGSSGVTKSLPHQAGLRASCCLGSSPRNRARELCPWNDLRSSWQELPELAGQNCWSQFGL